MKSDLNLKIYLKVQRRVTRIPAPLRELDYSTRLNARELTSHCVIIRLTSLETRWLRGDLIQFVKIFNELDHINWQSKLTWSEPRANKRMQLRRAINSTSSRHNFLTNRIANTWNSLSDSKSVNEFKSNIDPWLLKYSTNTSAL